MSLDEEFVDEDLVVRDAKTGEVFFRFDKKEDKESFLKIMENMVTATERNEEEGYRCGHCAAYPCVRTMFSQAYFERGERPSMIDLFSNYPELIERYKEKAKKEAERPGGFCFQPVRRCRDECKNYREKKERGFMPEGTCKIDGRDVKYDQECHIKDMKRGRFNVEELLK